MSIMFGTMLGLAYAMPPGPINVETVRQGGSKGFRAALAVQAGAFAADLVYALLASLSLATVFARPLPHMLIGVAGTLLLLGLGAASLRTGWRGSRERKSATSSHSDHASAATQRRFLEGLGLSFVNPYSVIFWLSLDSALLPTHQPAAALTLAAFFLSVAFWGVALAFGASSFRFLHSARVLRVTSVLCGLVFLASGLSLGHAIAVTGSF